jgi:uncharacterized protein YjbI with pentapeptide repeats
MAQQPSRTKAVDLVMRLVRGQDQQGLKRLVTITVLLLLAILTISLVRTPSYERSFIYLYFLVFALGIIMVGVGLTLWASDRQVPGSKGNLGAALVSGAIVAFAIFGLQLAAERQQDRLDERQRLHATINNAESLESNDLSNRDLRGFAFANKELRRASFARSKLKGVDFTGARIDGAIFRGTDLEGANLHKVEARDTSFHGANLKNAILEDSSLSGADFREAKLEGTKLTGAAADTNTRWPSNFAPAAAGVILLAPHADLEGVDLIYKLFDGANLTGANLRNANLTDAYISGVNLTRANLQGAILKDALGSDMDFRGADLRGADLRISISYDLKVADPKDAAEIYKLFTGVIVDSETIWPERFEPSRIPGGVRMASS